MSFRDKEVLVPERGFSPELSSFQFSSSFFRSDDLNKKKKRFIILPWGGHSAFRPFRAGIIWGLVRLGAQRERTGHHNRPLINEHYFLKKYHTLHLSELTRCYRGQNFVVVKLNKTGLGIGLQHLYLPGT